MRVGGVLATIMFAVLVTPMSGIAGESGTSAQPPQAAPNPGAKALSQGETVKKTDEKDVQTRGLFSKKKKKKPVGGAAGHSQPPEQTDPPIHDQPGAAR